MLWVRANSLRAFAPYVTFCFDTQGLSTSVETTRDGQDVGEDRRQLGVEGAARAAVGV